MDAISKLLGQDVYSSGVSPSSGTVDKMNKKTINAASNVSKRPLGTGNSVIKSLGAIQRTKKAFGKSDGNKHDYHGHGQSEHPRIVDEASYKTSLLPGKRGGTFSLPFDASITIPEGCFGKRDELTCRVATPQTRWRTCPTHLSPNEHVNSEIYTFTSPLHQLKTNVIICLHFQPVNSEFHELNVKVKWTGHIEWNNVSFLVKEMDNRPYVELSVNKLGTFLVTTTPKTEKFEVTPQGCLYQARLSRHISVRFPKKAITQAMMCTLQIIPIAPEKVQLSKEQNLADSTHITAVTEFIDITTSIECHFARPVTIKLPLPVGADQGADVKAGDTSTHKRNQDIAVLRKANMGWELIESAYRFTPTTVSFDVKDLARFCVVQCIPGRQKKMKDAVSLLEGRSEREKGEVCLFLSIKNKSWLALIEVFPKHIAATKVSGRISQGFTVVSRSQARIADGFSLRLPNRRQLLTKNTSLVESEENFELFEGLTWLVEVNGDVKISAQSDLRENAQLRYNANLKESFRTFFFEPIDMDPRPLHAHVDLVPFGLKDESLREKLTFSFKLEVEESTMVDFLVPDSPRETVPEAIIPEKPKLEQKHEPVPETPKKKSPSPSPPPPPTPKLKEVQTNVMRRLTTVKKPITVPERESKALTGRSLITLARYVPEGLTLAVHLELPDSTITGIGFDALSNNLSMSDVSYKILLYWKRKCKDKQMAAIRQLTNALREMNYHAIADAILKCHMNHKEFTSDCLSSSQDEDFKNGKIL